MQMYRSMHLLIVSLQSNRIVDTLQHQRRYPLFIGEQVICLSCIFTSQRYSAMLHYGYGMYLLLPIIKYIIDSEKSTYYPKMC
jgi:hypothetical protein